MTMFEVHGDPEEILAQMDALESEAERLAAENGGISSTVLRTDEGLMLVNHWETEEGMEAMAAAMRPKVEATGVGPQVGWRMYEVLRHRVPRD